MTLTELRERFHQAVANGDSCLFIDRDNNSAGTKKRTPHEASLTTSAYCVKVKPHLVALDFDQADGITLAKRCGKDLEGLGLKPVLLASGRAGHAHLWVTATRNTIQDIERLGKHYRADNRSGARIRPPLSLHRSGAAMTLIEPTDPLEALARLQPIEPIPRATKRATTTVASPENRPYRALDHRHEAERQTLLSSTGTDRSGHLFYLAAFYRTHGLTEEDYIKDVMNHPTGAGHKLYNPNPKRPGKPRRDIEKYLSRTWTNAEAARYRDPEAHRTITQIRESARVCRWEPRNNTQATLDVILNRADELGQTMITFSVRELAEWVGIGSRTAKNHVGKLREKGFLIIEKLGTGTQGTAYRLVTPYETTHSLTPPIHPTDTGCTRVCNLVGSQNAFYGRGGWRHLSLYLGGDEFTTSELAERAGRSYESCRKALNAMASVGLVKRTETGRWVATITLETVKAAAEMRNTAGKLDQLKRTNWVQRQGWIDHLTKLRASGIDIEKIAQRGKQGIEDLARIIPNWIQRPQRRARPPSWAMRLTYSV